MWPAFHDHVDVMGLTDPAETHDVDMIMQTAAFRDVVPPVHDCSRILLRSPQ
jgi:hypothetical protein